MGQLGFGFPDSAEALHFTSMQNRQQFLDASSRTAAGWALNGPSLILTDAAFEFGLLCLSFACLALLDVIRLLH